jgi:hypothetical protein
MTSFWVLVCFGVIGLPHTAVRCISYKDSKAVHRAYHRHHRGRDPDVWYASGGRIRARGDPGSYRAGSGDPDADGQSAAAFAAGIFLAAPMAAIMSTINAQLLQSSATIIKDLYLNLRPSRLKMNAPEADVGGDYAGARRVAAAGRLASAGDDHLAEPAGVWRAGSRLPVAAGAGLYWERATRPAR